MARNRHTGREQDVELDSFTGHWLPSSARMRRDRLRLSVVTDDDRMVVSVGGELDMGTVSQLQQYVQRVIDIGYHDLVLDLRDTSFMDTIGAGTLMGLHQSAAAEGGGVRLRDPTEGVQGLLDLTGVATVLEVESN